MDFPTDDDCERFFELIDELDQLPESRIPRAIELLERAEAPIVPELLRIHYSHHRAPDSELAADTRLADRYTIIEKLGSGGMGIVYRAKQERVERDVALKVIHPKLVAPKLVDRFLKEIATLGKLEHPNLVRIYDADLHASNNRDLPGILFYTMQVVEGTPIHRYVRDEQLPIGGIIGLLIKICQAVHEAHEQKVIHRDLKPSNILVTVSGEPIILDFGLAALAGELIGWEEQGISGLSGTPSYMAPEQYLGSAEEFGDGQSIDVYALGVIAFELLTGRSPYDFPNDASRSEMRRMVLEEQPRRLTEFLPDFEELDAKVSKCLRKEPADRYWTASGFAKALGRALQRLSFKHQPVESVWIPGPGKAVPGTEWILERKIGEGGIGEVWLADHPNLEEMRVFKFCADEEKVRFLKREASLFRLLKEKIGQHPHFVRLHDISLDDPPYFLAMDYIEGGDLQTWSDAQGGIDKVPVETRIEIIAQAARTLQAAHDAGILHRDIKPSNLLIKSKNGGTAPAEINVYVADFGIGQLLNEGESANTRLGFTRTMLSRDTDLQAGSQRYMAPEILSGGSPTVRSDIYSLGVVLYESLVCDLCRALPFDWFRSVDDPILREDLEKCLYGDPNRRFASANQLADSLARLEFRRNRSAAEEKAARARELAAYRRGLLRAGAIAAVIVAIVSFLAVYSMKESRRAKAATIASKLEAAAAMRNSQRSGRSFNSRDLIEAVRGMDPDNVRLEADYLESIRLTDLIRSDHPFSWSPKRGHQVIAPSFRRVLRNLGGSFELLSLSPDGEKKSLPVAPESAVGDFWFATFSPKSDGFALGFQTIAGSKIEFFDPNSPDPVGEVTVGLRATLGEYSADGRHFVSAHEGGTVFVWDLSTRNPSIVATLDSNRLPVELEVSDIGVSPASTEIAIASLDSLNLFVWDWNTDKLEKFYHKGAVIRLSWHPSGTHVAVACADGAAYIHDLSDSGERESVRQAVQDGRQIPVGDGQPIDIQFSRRGDLLLILTTNGELRCQNWSTGDIVVANTPVTFASKIAISDRGDLIAVSDPSADIFWRFDSGEAYRELKLTPASTRSDANLAQLGSGPLFAVVYDHAIYIVDINSNRVAAKTRVPDATSVAFDGGRDRLIASSMNGAHQWHCPLTDLVGNLHLQQLTNLPLPDALRHMAISGDGSTVAFGHTSKVVTCGLANDDEYRVIETGSLVGELQLDHTGRWVAGIHVPSGEGFLIDGEAITAEPANLGLAEHHAFLELGGRKALVVARPDGIRAIAIDDLDTQLWNWQADSPPTALSVRGENIAIGHADGGLTMLDSISGIPIVRIPTSGSPIASLALDSVGTHLLAINEEGRLHTWHLVHALAAAQPRAVQTMTRYPDADARAGVVPSPTLVHWTSGSFTEPLQAKLRNLIAADDKVADSPADPERRYRRGRAYHDLARIRSAEKDYQHCFKLLDGAKPDYAAGAYFYWARTWIDDRQQGWNPAEATNLIARSLALDPKNADSLFVSAFARYYCGDYEPALLDISRSIELDRGFNFPIKLYCKAGCLYALGELDEAQDLCAQASNLLSKAEPYAVPSFNELAKEIEILCNHQRRRSIPD